MAETLSTLSIISFTVAGISFVLAVFFWFFFKIPSVIGDLSGRNARKSIAKTRAFNEKSGIKGYKESKINSERGKITDTMGNSENLSKTLNLNFDETGLLDENRAYCIETYETELLEDNTTVLLDIEETGILVEDNVTAELDATMEPRVVKCKSNRLKIIEDIMLIHTDEVI